MTYPYARSCKPLWFHWNHLHAHPAKIILSRLLLFATIRSSSSYSPIHPIRSDLWVRSRLGSDRIGSNRIVGNSDDSLKPWMTHKFTHPRIHFLWWSIVIQGLDTGIYHRIRFKRQKILCRIYIHYQWQSCHLNIAQVNTHHSIVQESGIYDTLRYNTRSYH